MQSVGNYWCVNTWPSRLTSAAGRNSITMLARSRNGRCGVASSVTAALDAATQSRPRTSAWLVLARLRYRWKHGCGGVAGHRRTRAKRKTLRLIKAQGASDFCMKTLSGSFVQAPNGPHCLYPLRP